MHIDHVSVSRKQTFDQCPAHYRFKYHDRIVPDGPEPPYFAYGKTVHKIAEQYVERKDPKIFHEITMDVLTGKIEIEPGKKAPKLEGDYIKKFPLHLRNLKTFADRLGLDVPGHVEYQFRYDLSPPDGLMITGFIDRIIVRGDQHFIVDYKTTKKGPFRKNPVTVLTDLQLRMYAKVVEREFGAKAENIHCCLFYLDGDRDNLVGATYTQESLDEAEREMLRTYLEIRDMPPGDARGNVGWHCRLCPYRRQCPFYSVTEKTIASRWDP